MMYVGIFHDAVAQHIFITFLLNYWVGEATTTAALKRERATQ